MHAPREAGNSMEQTARAVVAKSKRGCRIGESEIVPATKSLRPNLHQSLPVHHFRLETMLLCRPGCFEKAVYFDLGSRARIANPKKSV
jgi:hypothetical protein